MRRGADSSAVYAVLDPPEPLTSSDVSALLGAVARGAGLLVVLSRNSTLGDSLGLNVDRRREARRVALAGPLARARPDLARGAAGGADEDDDDLEPDQRMPESQLMLRFERPQRGITRLLVLPGVRDSSKAETLDSTVTNREAAVAASFSYGRGRVVAISDARLLRNVELEESYAGVFAIRLLEEATPPGQRRLVFDEYHFGYGQRSTFFGLIGRALFGTRLGRVTIQLAIAALVLLLAVSPRAIKPAPRGTIERRSPLEHVGALARAYEKIGASRTAMRRLVRGLRRRHTPPGSSVPDEAYLEALAQRQTGIAGDLRVVLHALRQPVSSAELADAARALERVEHAVYPSSSLAST